MLSSMLFALAACNPPVEDDTNDTEPHDDDSGDTGEPAGPMSVAVGEVVDMDVAEDGTVSIDLADAGNYIVILTSFAKGQGETHGYGDRYEAPSHTEPSDVPPSRPIDTRPPTASASVGDERTFDVYDGDSYVTITAKVTAVSDMVVVWEDQTTPNELGTIDEEVVAEVIWNLEDHVMPRERQVFGEESDVDGSGKIDVLVSYTVNQYGAVAYVTQCDIGPVAGCGERGNEGEIVYLGVPDPDDSYGTPAGITETVAHELNHLIYGWHKYVAQDQTDASENIYLTEGMSALAQDLTGYNNGNQYVWAAALDATDYLGKSATIDSVSINDVLRGSSYYDVERDGALRGAAYLFLRYCFEQEGGMGVEGDGTLVDEGGMTWLHDWFDSPELGIDTVEATMGRSVEEVALDWYTALVVDGRVENDNPAYNFEPREVDPVTGYEFGVDMYALIHGWLQLEGPELQKIDRNDGELRSGGVEYLQAELTEAGTISVAVDPEAKAVARLLRVD